MFNTKQNKLKKKKNHKLSSMSLRLIRSRASLLVRFTISLSPSWNVLPVRRCSALSVFRYRNGVSLCFLYRRIKMDTSPPCSVLLVLPVLGEWVFFFERIYFKLLYLYMRRNDDFTTFHRDIIKNSDITIGAVWYDEILNIMPYTILYRTLQYVQLNILFVCRGARNV